MNQYVTRQGLLGTVKPPKTRENGVYVATTTAKKKARAPRKSKKRAASTSGPLLTAEVKRALGFLIAIAICGFSVLALFSFSSSDPGFSSSSTVGDVSNWCGHWGAVLADMLYQVVGYAAWSVLLFSGWIWLRFARRPGGSSLRGLTGLVATWWFAVFFGLLFFGEEGATFPAGGMVGEGTAGWLLSHVGTVGSYVVTFLILILSATVLFGIDWESVAESGVQSVEKRSPVVWLRIKSIATGVKSRINGTVVGCWTWITTPKARQKRLDTMARRPGDLEALEPEFALPDSIAEDPLLALDSNHTALEFDAEANLDEEIPTLAARRELVEVEYSPTGVEFEGGNLNTWPGERSAQIPQMAEEIPVAPVVESIEEPPVAAPRTSPVDLVLPQASAVGSVVDESVGAAVSFEKVAESDSSFVGFHDVALERPSVAVGNVAEEAATPLGEGLGDAIAEDAANVSPVKSEAILPNPVLAGDIINHALVVEAGDLASGGDASVGVVVRKQQDNTIYELPTLSLLDKHDREVGRLDETALRTLAKSLEQKLADFGVKGEVTAIRPGPIITVFEYLPAPGIKVSKISGLSDDIAMAMRALRVRIVAPIPGRGVVGIEIPNKSRQTVWFRDILVSKEFQESDMVLPMALGKTVDGSAAIADLSKMPHLLVAGTTGAGKSVSVNCMLMTLLYSVTPEKLRMILIDPKMLEFELYRDIPHLIHPVVTNPKLAAAALSWTCEEMDNRYRLLARWGTRNVALYNRKVEREMEDWTEEKARKYAPRGWPEGQAPPLPEKLPYIVVVIDELADLMMVAKKDVEDSIVRIAQKARASGIHLIVATQRPSADVITGLIKANMPSRISFQVRTKIDSRVILDQSGAETLLGMGDMLFLPPGVSAIERVHGPFCSDDEVMRVADFLRAQGEPQYEAELKVVDEKAQSELFEEEYDECYDMAVQIVTDSGKASTSMIQRHLKIGYNRAARIIDMMEREGVVGPADGARPRKVFAPPAG
jgi:DNA segregation ATPase FtsK/SpoIIIE-like protein